MDFNKAFLPVITFARIAIRRAFRDKTAIFFIFLFPLIFLFVFGGIFGKKSDVSFKIALVNQSSSAFSQQFVKQMSEGKTFKIDKNADSLDAAKEKMSRGQLDAAIVLPSDFGEVKNGAYPTGQAKIYYTQNSQSSAQTLESVLNSIFADINKGLVKADVPFTAVSEQLNTKSLSQFDYTFAGLLGFSIIGLGIFGPVNVFPELKKQGILRRLHTTPLKVWQYFVANVISQAVIGLLSMVLMFAVAMAVFHLKLSGNIIELALYIVFGIVMIFGIGMAIGGWAKDQNQAAPLANIVVFPMMFLSGTFFPRFLMPEWLQKVSAFLPLTPVIDGIRLIATEGKHLTQLGPQLVMMAAWLVIVYLIAFRSFRWE
ncbi:MAG TPA: ABC transporter permease [Candidatus Limnocylindrales bacterium]|nr:ABC transporter permease [Candidatus Limnocylindrales bacterium]